MSLKPFDALRRAFSQIGTMTRMPASKPMMKVPNTTSTNGACNTVPKKKCSATGAWLFNANANSTKKMTALSSHAMYFKASPTVMGKL